MILVTGQRQAQSKRRAKAFPVAFGPNAAANLGYVIGTTVQTKPMSIGFRGEAVLKQPIHSIWTNPTAIIRHADHGMVRILFHRNRERSLVGVQPCHSILCVSD